MIHTNIATLYAAFTSLGNNIFENIFTTNGDTNCPKYKLAEIRGM